jgi:hypothetical protein
MGTHLVHYTHGGEKVASYDAIWDVFVLIARDAKFHVLREQTHVLPLPFL